MFYTLPILSVISSLLTTTYGFLITQATPGKVVVAPGQKVSLLCAVDDDYEWCKFYHPDGRFCDFEWKRRKGNITTQDCQLRGKVKFHGAYDDRQCGVSFVADMQDSGAWRCEIEEYVLFRSRGAGRVRRAQMLVTVANPTTSTTTQTTTSLRTTSLTTSLKVTGATPGTTSVITSPSTTTSTATTKKIIPSIFTSIPTTPKYDKSNETTIPTMMEDEVYRANKKVVPSAIPQIDEGNTYDNHGSSSLVVGLTTFIIILIIAVILAGVLIYRKRHGSGLEVKDRIEPSGMSNTSFIDDRGISNNSGRDLHEFFPPQIMANNVH